MRKRLGSTHVSMLTGVVVLVLSLVTTPAQAQLGDGGISAQMQLRTAAGVLQRWPGWRSVSLGLVIEPR